MPISVPDWKEIWVPAWKKIWKPVVISEWFPTPDHHHDHDHHDHHAEIGWSRKDTTDESKVIWKRDNSDTTAVVNQAAASAVTPLTAQKP